MPAAVDHAARFARLPAPGAFAPAQVVTELGDGLVLRTASPADADALDHFTRVVQADPPDFEPIEGLGLWARDLISGRHPLVRPSDFWIVEDTRRGRIASSLGLIPHRMQYDGIGFDAGQVELVGTHPDYRHRGLVRRQIETLHRESAARGQRLQWISGIPGYYRQFGYEMALETEGAHICPRDALPGPDEEPATGLRWRLAEPSDADAIHALLARGALRSRVTCEVPAAFWRYEIAGKRLGNQSRREVHLLEDERGVACGLLMCADGMHGGTLLVKAAEITPGPDAPHAARALLARSREIGEARASATGEPFERLRLELGTAHPLYALAGDPPGEDRRAYALYVRIEDLAGFVELVAPALEARLAASSEAQRSGPLALAVGREGLRLQLERGRLRCVERWQPTTEERGHLAFPGLTFLQLLLGFRSLGELQHAFPDCYVWSEGHVSLVDVLFPAAPSHLVPVS